MNVKQKLLRHVIEETKLIGSKKKRTSKHLIICCPFHHEKTPSCSVVLDHPKFFPGTFHCFGCGESGSWNTLAERLHLKIFKFDKREMAEDDPFYELKGLLDYESSFHVQKLPKGCTKWTIQDGDWRGLEAKFLVDLGVYKWWDSFSDCYRVVFPADMNKKLRGYTAARTDNETLPKYRNTNGAWAQTSWLGYDFDKNYATNKAWSKFNKKAVCIVEGPVDFARCIRYGVPAVALLGTNNYSKQKRNSLLALGVELVVVMLDGDKAGISAARRIIGDLHPYVKVKNYKLPEGSDPGDCDKSEFKKVKAVIEKSLE